MTDLSVRPAFVFFLESLNLKPDVPINGVMSISGLSSAVGFSPARYAAPRDSQQTSDALAEAPRLIGEGAAMQRLRLQIERLGPHFRTVLMQGEIGTGKELAARALHARSSVADGPFVVCHAARLEEMGEKDREDDLLSLWREKASGGTLFLDGVEEIVPTAQQRLLRVLDRKTGFRMIASTSQNLRVMAASGLFRQDVFHRLAMVEITLEPLRNRREDIPALVSCFLERFSKQYEKPVDGVSHDAMERLMSYEWPGNIRELENVMHNGVLQCEDTVLRLGDLPSLAETGDGTVTVSVARSIDAPVRLQEVIERHVRRVLRECAGNKMRAAERLGISRSTLYRMLEEGSMEAMETKP
ncbi:MAG TPA: sigma 54-interacting transcriptional regulator [Edaphobacter sp.]|jgi:DNA-binding NtrC family response regulator|nr:sigma 54-interacting transcriptional regulator [Edaphobacter sp.]